MSLILVTLTARSDSDFERSNVNLKENKHDGVNPNSNDIDYYVRKNEGKILWFSADCFMDFGAPLRGVYIEGGYSRCVAEGSLLTTFLPARS